MFASELSCPRCGNVFPCGKIAGLCSCGSPLLVHYRTGEIRKAWNRDVLVHRPATLWRYRELLPVCSDHNLVSLGEGFTPLLPVPRLASELGVGKLWIKDESRNPTGSFKDRGLSVAISMAKELGICEVALPSAGNAGASAAAYAARGGLKAHVYMPSDSPAVNQLEVRRYGGKLELVDGLIHDCGREVEEKGKAEGWFNLSTLKEPYRVEGKKTMGLEIAEQLGWKLPDVVIYPTGGGTGMVGMWKAFAEMEEIGWIGENRPRMVSVQAAGCAPIVRAFEQGKERADPWPQAETVASGLRVPNAVGDFLILRAIRESNGAALSVGDGEMFAEIQTVGRLEGIYLCPEAAAGVAGLRRLAKRGWIRPEESVLLFNTASGLKYSHINA